MADEIYPILIPSKGRPHGATMRILKEAGVAHLVGVEPSEEGLYRKAGHRVFVLEKDGQGLRATRSQLHQSQGGWYWMLDDDITSFWVLRGGKNVKIHPREAFLVVQKEVSGVPNLAQFSMAYRQYLRPDKENKLRVISPCCVAVCNNAGLLKGWKYGDFPTKLDKEWTLRIVTSGFTTACSGKVAFACPGIGTNKGGLYEVYQNKADENTVLRLAQKYPGICKPIRKNEGRGGLDVKIDWLHLAKIMRPKKANGAL